MLQAHCGTESLTCLDVALVKVVMCAELFVFNTLNGCAGLSSEQRVTCPVISARYTQQWQRQ